VLDYSGTLTYEFLNLCTTINYHPMPDFSFEIKNSRDFFAKLLADYQEYRKDTTNSRTALNCSMTAWHLIEWIYDEFSYNTSSNFTKISSFQEHLKSLCPSLKIMQDLTNGTKHSKLTKYKPHVKEARLHEGDFSSDFSRDFDITTLEIELNDGTKKYFEDEARLVVDFWTNFLKANHAISI